MTKRLSIDEKNRRAELRNAQRLAKKFTSDSFQNFAMNLGVGSDNPTTYSTYGFNPITRVRQVLEWIYRGSWLGGLIVDSVADDMTREGIDIGSTLDPDDAELLQRTTLEIGLWDSVNEGLKWSRLFGGSIIVAMIDGQDPKYPLRFDSIRKGDLLGFQVYDRWTCTPDMNNLVDDRGPDHGKPKFYRTVVDEPNLIVHHSRVIRLEGLRLPYYQRIQEMGWGLSVLERIYDRMIGVDSASTGMAQLVYKAYVRRMKVKGLRQIVATGGDIYKGFLAYVDLLRRQQNIEGIATIDAEDDLDHIEHGAFAGLSDVTLQLLQQVSGAAQIPLVRLLGQSPAGLNSTGESDLRTYYDEVRKNQVTLLKRGLSRFLRVIMAHLDIKPPENFDFQFVPLWQLTEPQKAEVSELDTRRVIAAVEAGVIANLGVAMKELKQGGKMTNRWTNISDEDVADAEKEPIEFDPEPEQPDGGKPPGEGGGMLASIEPGNKPADKAPLLKIAAE